MTSGWRVLDFSGFTGKISYSRGQLLVVSESDGGKPGEKLRLPLAQVAVILVGYSTELSGAVLAKLGENDISLLTCDWRGVPVVGLHPWSEHTRVAARQNAQALQALPRKKAAWKNIISAKIAGQANNLEVLGRPLSRELRILSSKVRSGDPENLEAQAARKYWSALFCEPFVRRPGESASATNSCLDYGYTILRGFGIRAVASAGLSPTLGLFHHSRSNPFCLVDDLIEPFRPVVDYYVYEISATVETLDTNAKQSLMKIFSSSFLKTGETIPTVLTSFAQIYGKYVERDIERLSVPVWEGPFDADRR